MHSNPEKLAKLPHQILPTYGTGIDGQLNWMCPPHSTITDVHQEEAEQPCRKASYPNLHSALAAAHPSPKLPVAFFLVSFVRSLPVLDFLDFSTFCFGRILEFHTNMIPLLLIFFISRAKSFLVFQISYVEAKEEKMEEVTWKSIKQRSFSLEGLANNDNSCSQDRIGFGSLVKGQ